MMISLGNWVINMKDKQINYFGTIKLFFDTKAHDEEELEEQIYYALERHLPSWIELQEVSVDETEREW